MSTTTQDLSDDRRAAWALVRLDAARRQWEQRATLGTADGRLLWLFTDRRPRTLREIADALGLEQSTVNRQVNAAIDSGLLRRHREPGRSARLVEPTDAGIETFERDVTHTLSAYDAALTALPPADAPRFLDLLERFVDAYSHTVDPHPTPTT